MRAIFKNLITGEIYLEDEDHPLWFDSYKYIPPHHPGKWRLDIPSLKLYDFFHDGGVYQLELSTLNRVKTFFISIHIRKHGNDFPRIYAYELRNSLDVCLAVANSKQKQK